MLLVVCRGGMQVFPGGVLTSHVRLAKRVSRATAAAAAVWVCKQSNQLPLCMCSHTAPNCCRWPPTHSLHSPEHFCCQYAAPESACCCHALVEVCEQQLPVLAAELERLELALCGYGDMETHGHGNSWAKKHRQA